MGTEESSRDVDRPALTVYHLAVYLGLKGHVRTCELLTPPKSLELSRA